MEYASGASSEAIGLLENFWPRMTREVQNLASSDFKNPELPLARIKKIMKLDDEVKMISAEAPIIFAKAAEMFIQEVTIRSWLHTEDNKRRTLQRNDVALAISKYDQFDFLIDIVPREEIKPTKKESHSPNANSSATSANQQNATVLNSLDPNTANLLSAINGSSNSSVSTGANQSNNGNIQYFFAVPANGTNSTSNSASSMPVQFQSIQGLSNNIQGLQTLQGFQGIQGLQGAQIILGSSNGQPAVFSVPNRDS
ncbi:nuclear transcription factor Y subunit gamma isoform X1 [Brachionus plicatilis]|uniref:Nuclear transcription factor Y subunit gamma n=1 Tax=Brachionus plicatilis TaxID=10195 RepID=A0A3M7T3V1_BRAPC|nr:nuclear transcription factor Y subunit gamma isoform X1 [Brachionus plicatilis]